MQLHAVLQFVFVCLVGYLQLFSTESKWYYCLKPGTREEGKNQIFLSEVVENARFPVIRIVYFCKQINDVICFAEFVLDVKIFCMNTQRFQLVFERSRLFKKAVSIIDLH